ncbi:MAG: hypothetical protein B7Z72_03310 [Gemmatimonadetes bacterium 21-71-4]|nr:MAG: hypothetical protein B7Z72_03310 [Gemmatimonadetes bacterium 21-71-4]
MTGPLGAWWRGEDEATRVALVLILLAAAMARVSALAQPMRYDESVTYLYFIGGSWAHAIAGYEFPNNHLLYTVVAKLGAMLAGNAPWVLRFPAFVAGLAIVPLTYAVGRALYSPTAALVGAALAAAATQLVLFSANARGYAFVIVACLALLLVAERIRSAGGTPRRWIAFALIAAAGLATIPVMLYPLGAVAAWFGLTVIIERGRGAWRPLGELTAALLGAASLTGLAYLPIVRVNGLAALTANRFVTASPWPTFFYDFFARLAGILTGWAEPYPWPVALLLGALAAAGLVRRRRVTRATVSPLLAAYVWSALLLLATHRMPYDRIWLWLLPLVVLAVGSAVELLLDTARGARLRSSLPLLAGALAVAGVAWGFARDALGNDADTGVFAAAEPLARVLVGVVQPGDRILAPIPANAPLQYYLLRAGAGADTALLSTPVADATREIIVLAPRYHQTIQQAIAQGMVDTARFGPVVPGIHARDGDVYVAERKGSQP